MDNNKRISSLEEIEAENERIKKNIDTYKSDSLYSQCYNSIVKAMNNLACTHNKLIETKEIDLFYYNVNYFVNHVLESDLKEIELRNIHLTLYTKSLYVTAFYVIMNDSIFKDDSYYNMLLEMVTFIVLWDKMPEKDELVMNSFKEWFEIINDCDGTHIYKGFKDLYGMIAKRMNKTITPNIEDLQAEIKKLKQDLEGKNTDLEAKKQEIEMLQQGYYKEEENFKPYGTEKRIQILHYLLDMGSYLSGEERAQFKDLCKFITKSEDSTLERLLSQNSLIKMKENYMNLEKEFPILKRK